MKMLNLRNPEAPPVERGEARSDYLIRCMQVMKEANPDVQTKTCLLQCGRVWDQRKQRQKQEQR